MRTNIDIDDATLEAAMRAGPFTTKKDAVEAGLKLLARQAAYREILKWEGKLRWDGDEEGEAAAAPPISGSARVAPRPSVNEAPAKFASTKKKPHGRR
jgi:antitoxin ParD1/3/4